MFSLSRRSFKASVDVGVYNNAYISKIDYIWQTKGCSTAFHDRTIVGLCLCSLVLSVRPVIEAFNMDCSLLNGNVCQNFVVIILKIPSVLKTLKSKLINSFLHLIPSLKIRVQSLTNMVPLFMRLFFLKYPFLSRWFYHFNCFYYHQ